MEIATEKSWKIINMINPTKIGCSISLNPEEYNLLIPGFIPNGMEDKWFIYHKNNWLHFHRSWTGIEVMKFKIEYKNEHIITEINLAEGFHNFEKVLDEISDLKHFNPLIEKLIGRGIF